MIIIELDSFYQLTVHNVVVAGIKKSIFHYFIWHVIGMLFSQGKQHQPEAVLQLSPEHKTQCTPV